MDIRQFAINTGSGKLCRKFYCDIHIICNHIDQALLVDEFIKEFTLGRASLTKSAKSEIKRNSNVQGFYTVLKYSRFNSRATSIDFISEGVIESFFRRGDSYREFVDFTNK